MSNSYIEIQNIYRSVGIIFTVFFVVVMLLFFAFFEGASVADYVLFGGMGVFVVVTYLILYFLNFSIGYDATGIVYAYTRKKSIPFGNMNRVWIENIDYMGRFGGVGSRKRGGISIFTFVDTGNYICIETTARTYYFSIKNKAIWMDWLSKNAVNIQPLAKE